MDIPNQYGKTDRLPEITKMRIADWFINNTMLALEQISEVTS